MSATRDDPEKLVLTHPGEVKTYGAGEDGANSNNRASRVAGGVILTALAMCAAALSADPIVGTQMGMGMFSSLGDGRGHKGGRSSSGDAAVSTLGEIDFFPMTVYLADKNPRALERFKGDWDVNHNGGSSGVQVIEEPNMGRWPKTRDYELISSLISDQLPGLEVPVHVHYAEVVPGNGHSVAVREGQEKFAAYSLQHLQAYLEGKKSGAPALVIADRSSSISPLGEEFSYSHTGRAEEFDSFILSFLYKGPRQWDVLFCDKGVAGVSAKSVKRPVLSFSNHKWVGKYLVYKWTGDGGASGSGLYMVSKRFLDRLPAIIKESPFTMVDGWLVALCRSGSVTCLSYLESVEPLRKKKVNNDNNNKKAKNKRHNKPVLGEMDEVESAATEDSASALAAAVAGGEEQQKHEGGKLFARQELSWRDTVVVNPSKVLGGSAALSILNGVGMSSDVTKGGPLDANSIALPALGGLLVGGDAGAERTKAKKVSMEDLFTEDVDVGAFDAAAAEAVDATVTATAAGDDEGTVTQEEEEDSSSSVVHLGKSGKSSSAKSYSSSPASSSKKKASKSAHHVSAAAEEEEEELKALAAGILHLDDKDEDSSSSKKNKNKNEKKSAAAAGKKAVDSDDVDSMLDWWSDEDGGGSKRNDAAAAAAEPSTADDVAAAAAKELTGGHRAKKKSNKKHHATSASASGTEVAEESVEEVFQPIKQSPVLEGEDPMAVHERNQKQLRKVSAKAAQEDKDMMEKAAWDTDAAADAKAEGGAVDSGGRIQRGKKTRQGGIILDTMPSEHAWKYVSRIHHKDEVEAAESAVAAQQEEEAAAASEEEQDEEEAGAGNADAAALEELAGDVQEELELASRGSVGKSKHHHNSVKQPTASSSSSHSSHSSAKSSAHLASWHGAHSAGNKHSSASGSMGKLGNKENEYSPHQQSTSRHHNKEQKQHVVEEEEEVEEEADAESLRHRGMKRKKSSNVARKAAGGGGHGSGGGKDGPPDPKSMMKAADEEWRAGGAWRSAFAWQQNPAAYHQTKEKVFSSADEAAAAVVNPQGVVARHPIATLGRDSGPSGPVGGYGVGTSGFGGGGAGGNGHSMWANSERYHPQSALGKGSASLATTLSKENPNHDRSVGGVGVGGAGGAKKEKAQHQGVEAAPRHHHHRTTNNPTKEPDPDPDPEEWKRHKVDGPVPVEGLGASEWKEFSAEDDFLDDFGPGSKQLIDQE